MPGNEQVRVTIDISDGSTTHQITVDVVGREQISIESCIEELRAMALKWAASWLKYPDIQVTIKNKEI